MPFDVQAIVVAMCRDMHIRGFRYAEFQAEPVIIKSNDSIVLSCRVADGGYTPPLPYHC